MTVTVTSSWPSTAESFAVRRKTYVPPLLKLAVVIGDESQELDPTSPPLREQVWSSFFVSSGKLDSEAVVLFDSRHGRTSKAENDYRGPNVAGEADLFVVTHDSRSGVAFQSFKLKAE